MKPNNKFDGQGNSMPKKKKKPHTPAMPKLRGDFGPGTQAANAGTTVEPILNEDGQNPNNRGRRRRVNQIEKMTDLSMRQHQAAMHIQEAFCSVEMLSSGSELKERVQSSPKPDATIAAQIDAQSRLYHAMKAVPSAMRYVVEHVCWHNLPISDLGKGRCHGENKSNLKVALDLVANRLKY